MAINPKNMVKDMLDSLNRENADTNKEMELISHAMMYCKTADYLWEALDIYDLCNEKNLNGLKVLLAKIQPKYDRLSELLNNPRCIEDWIRVVSGLKTRALGEYRKIYHENIVSKFNKGIRLPYPDEVD